MKKFLCLLTSVILSCSLTFSSFAHTSDTTKTVSKKYIEYTQSGNQGLSLCLENHK